MESDLKVRLYTLLNVKGVYNHTQKERLIFKRLKEPDISDYCSALYNCRDSKLIEVRGERNLNCSLYYRDLFITPNGEKELNRLKVEYMKLMKKQALRSIRIALEIVASIAGILSLLLMLMK